MSDYISKKKLISHIEAEYKSFGEDYDALQILGDVEDFPTEERPHGEWIYRYMEGQFCSVCNNQSLWKFNFCPNCGASMKGGE